MTFKMEMELHTPKDKKRPCLECVLMHGPMCMDRSYCKFDETGKTWRKKPYNKKLKLWRYKELRKKAVKVVATKNMSTGSETLGAAWQEIKIFETKDSIFKIMEWADDQKQKITLTFPEK